MTDRELMQQALEALEEINKLSIGENAICLPAEIDGAMDALRERLAQPAQQPVACVIDGDLYFHHEIDWEDLAYQGHGVELLYTAPQPREWQGLTDETMDVVYFCVEGGSTALETWREQARAIEQILREKNT